MVLYVLDAAVQDEVRAMVVVVGHGADVGGEGSDRAGPRPTRTSRSSSSASSWGPGHAVCGGAADHRDEIGDTDGDVLILPGDTPLLRRGRSRRLLAAHRESQAALTVLTATVDDPYGLRPGRAREGRLRGAHRRGA